MLPHNLLIDEMGRFAESIPAGRSVVIELTKRGLQRSLENDLKVQLDYETYA